MSLTPEYYKILINKLTNSRSSDIFKSMEALTYSETRNNLKTVMDSICDEGRTVIVTRKDKRNVVMMSLDDYNGIQETLHLLSSARNAERLLKSIREIEAEGGSERELIE